MRSHFPHRRALDFVSWLPFTVPGLILSFAMLSLFLGVVIFRPLYGTTAILVFTAVLTSMPLGVQIVKSGLLQLGAELEEASRDRRRLMAGDVPSDCAATARTGVADNRADCVRRRGAQRELRRPAVDDANQPLSMLQLNYLAQGKNEVASVIAFVVMLASIGGAFLARAAGFRGAAL